MEVLEDAETVDETTEETEIAALPDMIEGEDLESSEATEVIVGGGSISLRESYTDETLSEMELYVGDYHYIDVLVDEDYEDEISFTCVSSNEDIVQISNCYSDEFEIKGIAPGNAQITVSTEDGNECTLNVTVKAAEITFYRGYDGKVQDLIIGTDYNSTVYIYICRNGDYQYASEYTCTSSNENVAKVYTEDDEELTIEGISPGKATITVTNEYGESGVLDVTVKESGSSGYLYKDPKGNLLQYTISDDQITIVGYKTAKGIVTIPSRIDGMDVVTVGSWAFYNCTSISKVSIGNGVKTIREYAFYGCSGLASVELPDSIESIGDAAFLGCSGLTSFQIPPKVTRIEDSTFSGCSLGSVTIPEGVDMWNSTHPFYKPIYWAAEHGITNGYSDGTFGVNRNCTRGEAVMFLWKMMGKPAVKSVSKRPFKDVAQSNAFYKAILWASQNGITKGYPDGTFGINKTCTRGEIMMFLWRAKGKPAPKAVSKSPFKDVAKTHAFYNAILWGSQKGITKGYSDGTFGINRNCTRGEIVTFLYRIR